MACLIDRPCRLVAEPKLTALASTRVPTALLIVCKQIQAEIYQVWSHVLSVLVRGTLPPRMLLQITRSCAAWIRSLDVEANHKHEDRTVSVPISLAYYLHAIQNDLTCMTSLQHFNLHIWSHATFCEACASFELIHVCWPGTLLPTRESQYDRWWRRDKIELTIIAGSATGFACLLIPGGW